MKKQDTSKFDKKSQRLIEIVLASGSTPKIRLNSWDNFVQFAKYKESFSSGNFLLELDYSLSYDVSNTNLLEATGYNQHLRCEYKNKRLKTRVGFSELNGELETYSLNLPNMFFGTFLVDDVEMKSNGFLGLLRSSKQGMIDFVKELQNYK